MAVDDPLYMSDLAPYSHGWTSGIGFANPFTITKHTLLSKRFYNTFFFALMEKNLQYSFSSLIDWEDDISGYVFNTAETWGTDEVYFHHDVEDRLQGICTLARSLWITGRNRGDWITESAFNATTGTSFWAEIEDVIDISFLRDYCAVNDQGKNYIDILLGGDTNSYNLSRLEDPLLFQAVGVVIHFCRYQYLPDYNDTLRDSQDEAAAKEASPALHPIAVTDQNGDLGITDPPLLAGEWYLFDDRGGRPEEPGPKDPAYNTFAEGSTEYTFQASNPAKLLPDIGLNTNIAFVSTFKKFSRGRHADHNQPEYPAGPYVDTDDDWSYHYIGIHGDFGMSIYSTDINYNPIKGDIRYAATVVWNGKYSTYSDEVNPPFGETGRSSLTAFTSSLPVVGWDYSGETPVEHPPVQISTPIDRSVQGNGYTYCSYRGILWNEPYTGAQHGALADPARPPVAHDESTDDEQEKSPYSTYNHNLGETDINLRGYSSGSTGNKPTFISNMLEGSLYFIAYTDAPEIEP